MSKVNVQYVLHVNGNLLVQELTKRKREGEKQHEGLTLANERISNIKKSCLDLQQDHNNIRKVVGGPRNCMQASGFDICHQTPVVAPPGVPHAVRTSVHFRLGECYTKNILTVIQLSISPGSIFAAQLVFFYIADYCYYYHCC